MEEPADCHAQQAGAAKPAARRSPQPAQGVGRAAAGAVAAAELRAAGDIAPAALRRLEQRLEAERRHTDRQVQRLERRIEEVACASAAGGRWAELRGHVDGLAETVQSLVRGADDAALRGAAASRAPPGAGEAGSAGVLEELGRRVSATAAQASEFEARLRDFGARLQRAEEAGGSSAEVFDLQRQVAALAGAMGQLCDDQARAAPLHVGGAAASRGGSGSDAALRSLDAWDGSHRLARLGEQVAELTARLEQAELHLQAAAGQREVAHLHDEVAGLSARVMDSRRHLCEGDPAGDCGGVRAPPWDGECSLQSETVPSEDDPRDRLDDLCEQVAALRAETEDQGGLLQDHVAECSARLQDLEQGIQDVASAQEVRQQVNHVSEQALRLALRTQRVSQGHGAGEEEVRALRGEFGAFGEELSAAWMRVEGVECGLEGMTSALHRVCEELAQLRARVDGLELDAPGAAGAGWAAAGDAGAAGGEGAEAAGGPEGAARAAAGGAGEAGAAAPVPLRCKVQEVERGLESMAEVVWDLRKQVRGLRTRAAGSRGELERDEAAAERQPGLCESFCEPAPGGSASDGAGG